LRRGGQDRVATGFTAAAEARSLSWTSPAATDTAQQRRKAGHGSSSSPALRGCTTALGILAWTLGRPTGTGATASPAPLFLSSSPLTVALEESQMFSGVLQPVRRDGPQWKAWPSPFGIVMPDGMPVHAPWIRSEVGA